MIKNYFISAYRHLANGTYLTVINVFGLSIGITAFFLILQYVSFELSYDEFHSNHDEIYRVTYAQFENGVQKNSSAKNFVGIRDLIQSQLPEVKSHTGFSKVPANTGFLFSYEDKIFNEMGGVLNADTNFFHVFPTLLLRGNPNTLLNDPHNIVLSESMARKIFGDADPMNQHLDRIDDHSDDLQDYYIVTGIFKDIPENSHFHTEFITHGDQDLETVDEYWTVPYMYTYLTIEKDTDVQTVQDRLNNALHHVAKDHAHMKGVEISLQSLGDIHFNDSLNDELEPGGNWALTLALCFAGFIILALAWVNYINIETARFTKRVKEVSIRRITGSSKSDITIQFLVEYFCITFLSVGLAWLLIQFSFPYFSYITGVPLFSIQWPASYLWIGGVGLFILGSIITGSAPALILNKARLTQTLKGNFGQSIKGIVIRKMLLLLQFSVAIVLIAILLVAHQQLDFMRLSNKNIDIENVITLRNPLSYSNQDLPENYQDYKTLENELLQHPSIKEVSSSSAIPGTEIGFTLVDFLKRNADDPYDPTRYKLLFVNYDFISTYNLKIIAGRNFSTEYGDGENWNTLILNESAIRTLGFKTPDEALNQTVQFSLWDWQNEKEQQYMIIGVVEDYHHESVKEEIFPMIFYLNDDSFQQVYYSVKLNAGIDPNTALADIRKTWMEIFPERPFDYFFMDEYYDQQYTSEKHFGRIFGLFAGMALFITCLGIIGLTLFESRIRSKEVSIRKVLGAPVLDLIALLSKDFFKVIAYSAIISFPIFYIFSEKWLANYPTRIDVNGWSFVSAIVAVVGVAILIVGSVTLRSANVNPVDNLKTE